MRIIVLHGKDPYMIANRSREIAEMLRQAYGDIEQFEYDGETAELAAVLDELRSYGLIQQHKLVILDKADDFLAAKGSNDDGRYRRAMEAYAQNPVDSATLLMRADTWRPGNLDKLIAKVGAVFKIEPPNEATALKWCFNRVQKRYEAAIEPEAAERLVQQIGPDLARLDAELSKLASFVGRGNSITREHVIELVGMSREEQVWSIQSTIASGNAAMALSKLRELMGVSNHPEELISWAICDLMRKVHAAAQLLREGVNGHAAARQLKLWGDSIQPIMTAARGCEPGFLAEMLKAAIETDLKSKTGLGDSTRSLEALTVRIADGIGAARR